MYNLKYGTIFVANFTKNMKVFLRNVLICRQSLFIRINSLKCVLSAVLFLRRKLSEEHRKISIAITN